MTLSDAILRAGGPVRVAKLCSVARTTPYRWMTGERSPCREHLVRILDAAGATPDERLAVLQGSPPVVQPVTPVGGLSVHEAVAA